MSHDYIADVSAALGRAHVINDLRKHIIHPCTREHFPIKDTALKESSKLVSLGGWGEGRGGWGWGFFPRQGAQGSLSLPKSLLLPPLSVLRTPPPTTQGWNPAFAPISNSSIEFSTSFSPSWSSSPRRGHSYWPFQLPLPLRAGACFFFSSSQASIKNTGFSEELCAQAPCGPYVTATLLSSNTFPSPQRAPSQAPHSLHLPGLPQQTSSPTD